MKIHYSFPDFFIGIILFTLLGGCMNKPLNSLPVATQNTPTNTPPVATQNVPTNTPPIEPTQTLMMHPPQSYFGLIPGKSTKSEVLEKWGNPNVIRVYEDYESLHYYKDGSFEFFLVEDGILQAISSTDHESRIQSDGHPATVSDLTNLFGPPDVITPIPNNPIYVFPSYGVAVCGDLWFFQYFIPMRLEEYESIWGKYPLGNDPFPLIPSVEQVGIIPGKSTKEDVEKLIGTPDLIVKENKYLTMIYLFEPNAYGQLMIFINKQNYVDSMSVTEIQMEIFFKDVVEKYGNPDVIQFMPDEEGNKYGRQGLVYLRQGIKFSSNCYLYDCKNIPGKARVIAKWYFNPMSLDEYKEYSPESDFAEWRGFTD